MMRSFLKRRFAWLVILALLLTVSVAAAQEATGESSIVPTLIDLPMLPDAADVLQVPGMTSYTTTASLEDVLAFYQEQVTTLGGQADNPPLLTEPSGAMFGFTVNDQPILLVVTTDLAGAIIDLYQLNDADMLGFTAEVPDERGTVPEPTEASGASGVCEPGTSSVPITPDATSVQDMGGGMALSYMTSMSPADVTAFYEEQLATLGGQVSSPMPATDFMAMLNVQQNDLSYAITIAPMGTTTNVTISSMTMQTTITTCTTGAPAAAPTEVPPETGDSGTDSSGGCQPGVLPLLPDASNIQEMSALGMTTYTTAATVPDAVTFYEEQFAALGAQAVQQIPVTDAMASPVFMIENQPVILTITAMGGSTSVSISIMGSNPFRGAAPCGGGS